MIEVRDLDVRYAEVHALRGVNLSVAPGEFVLIGGPSGSGKSTLAHTLMGLIPQVVPARVQGHISVAGCDPRQTGIAQLAQKVGLVLQNPATQLFSGTVEEEVAFGPRNLGLPATESAARVRFALEATGCTHLCCRAVRHLSSGEQQRVVIAAALAMRPAVLILDEPAANLDAEGVRLLVEVLVRLRRDCRVTVIVIEHRLAPFMPHADRVVWLADGTVASPPPPCTPLPLSRRERGRGDGGEEVRAPLVSLRHVAAGYDGRSVLQDCSLTLCRGDFAALVGPNGAGKTTLARVLAGILRPRRGRVVWHTGGRGPRVGLLQQNPLHQLVCDTVEEEVAFGPRNLGVERAADVAAVLAQADLTGLRHRPTHALSVGEQQRTALAATLALNPALLILDEPTIGQDGGHLFRLMDSLADLNRAGQTVLLITHDRQLVAQYADRVWVMDEGRMAEYRSPIPNPDKPEAKTTKGTKGTQRTPRKSP